VLRFGPRTLNRLYDYFDDSLITKIGVSMPVDEGMFGYLLSYGDALEVVEPAWVREGLVERMRSALEQYHNG
jgi:predicted DNA-binding transcriptional regulator YafY